MFSVFFFLCQNFCDILGMCSSLIVENKVRVYFYIILRMRPYGLLEGHCCGRSCC